MCDCKRDGRREVWRCPIPFWMKTEPGDQSPLADLKRGMQRDWERQYWCGEEDELVIPWRFCTTVIRFSLADLLGC